MLGRLYAFSNAVKLVPIKRIAINTAVSVSLYYTSDVFAKEYELYILQNRPQYYGSERAYLKEVSTLFTLLYFGSGIGTLRFIGRSKFITERVFHIGALIHQSYQYGAWFDKRWILSLPHKYYKKSNEIADYYKNSRARIINIIVLTYTTGMVIASMMVHIV